MTPARNNMIKQFQNWLAHPENASLRDQGDAGELMLADLTPAQHTFLSAFVRRWDAMEQSGVDPQAKQLEAMRRDGFWRGD